MAIAFDELKTVTANGVSLAYCDDYAGEPVVLIHGSSSDIRTWDRQLPAIGEKHRAIAYSRRYARPNVDIALGQDDQMLPHVEDLAAFLDGLGISRAHLVGHSWGGFIALLAAIRHPQIVRSLVLMEPPVLTLFVSTPPQPHEIFRLLLRRPRTAIAIVRFGLTALAPAVRAYRRGDDEAAMRAFGHGVFGKASFENISPERKQQARDNVGADRAQVLGAGLPPISDDEVRRVSVPVMLIVGDRSPAIMRLMSDHLDEILPNSRKVFIANASHLMHEDNPKAVNDVIMKFLDQHMS